MSFGPSQAQKNANNTQGGITQQAIANSQNLNNLGGQQLNTGGANVTSGTNFFDTLLHGNAANTSALLAPSIAQNRATNQQQIQAINTLTPRGGGRSGTLFQAGFEPSVANTNLFNTGRIQAAQTLPQIGLAQQGIGTNLFGTGTAALNTGSSSNANLAQQLLQQQQQQNSVLGGLGSGLFGLLTAPFGGGSSILGKIFSGGGTNPGIFGANASQG